MPRLARKLRRTRKFDRAPARPWTKTTGVGCGAVGSKPSRTSRPSGIEAASVPSADSSPATVRHHAISEPPPGNRPGRSRTRRGTSGTRARLGGRTARSASRSRSTEGTVPSLTSPSRPVLGPREGAGQENGVEQEHPVPPFGVGLEVLAGPAEGDVGVLPVLDQLAGDVKESALDGGLHDAPQATFSPSTSPRRSKRAPLKLPHSRTWPELTR